MVDDADVASWLDKANGLAALSVGGRVSKGVSKEKEEDVKMLEGYLA